MNAVPRALYAALPHLPLLQAGRLVCSSTRHSDVDCVSPGAAPAHTQAQPHRAEFLRLLCPPVLNGGPAPRFANGGLLCACFSHAKLPHATVSQPPPPTSSGPVKWPLLWRHAVQQVGRGRRPPDDPARTAVAA